MIRLIRTEVRKLTTTPALAVTVAITFGLSVLGAVTNILLAGQPGLAPLGSPENATKVLSVAAVTSTAIVILGIMAMASEYRTRTIVTTFLFEPHRVRVIAAKLVTIAGLGAALGFVTFGVTLCVAVPVFGAKGIHDLPIDVNTMWIGTTVATAAFGVLGVALGALTRNTIAAVIGALVWMQVIEQAILAPALPGLAKWLPTSAAIALTAGGTGSGTGLALRDAAMVLVAWALVLAAVATPLVIRHDPS